MSMFLLASVTIFYAGYNLLVKISGTAVPETVTTTIVATLCLQLAALGVSTVFAIILLSQGGHSFRLPTSAVLFAVLAGFCIGAAEIAYFYLFSKVGVAEPMSAGVAIPIVVSGTIVITMLASFAVLKEAISWYQLLGSSCMIVGMIILIFGEYRWS